MFVLNYSLEVISPRPTLVELGLYELNWHCCITSNKVTARNAVPDSSLTSLFQISLSDINILSTPGMTSIISEQNASHQTAGRTNSCPK